MPKVSIFMSKAAELKQLDYVYPTPQRPEGSDSYSFPTNADNLSDGDLDNWMLFLGAWRGYLNFQISKLEGELMILSQGFDLMLSTSIAYLEAESPKKLLKRLSSRTGTF